MPTQTLSASLGLVREASAGGLTARRRQNASAEDWQSDPREADDRDQFPEAAVAQATFARSLRDETLDAEHQMKVGSRAFERDQRLRSQREDVAQGRRDFRQTLAEASTQQQGAGKPTTSTTTGGEPGSRQAAAGDAQPGDGGKASQPSGQPAGQADGAGRQTPAHANPANPAPGAANPRAVAAASTVTSKVQIGQQAVNAATQALQGVTSAARAGGASGAGASAGQVSATSSARGGAESGPVQQGKNADPAKSVKTPQTKDPQAASRKDDATSERILRFARLNMTKDKASATLRLDPPELGKIRIQMQVNRDMVSLTIEAKSDVAHRLLQEQADVLRRGLEASGMQVERLEIRPAAETDARTEADGSQHHTPDQEGQADSHGAATERDAHTASPIDVAFAQDDADGVGAKDGAPVLLAMESLVNVMA